VRRRAALLQAILEAAGRKLCGLCVAAAAAALLIGSNARSRDWPPPTSRSRDTSLLTRGGLLGPPFFSIPRGEIEIYIQNLIHCIWRGKDDFKPSRLFNKSKVEGIHERSWRGPVA